MAAPLKKEKIDQIIELRKKGLSYSQVAKETGLSIMSVARKSRQFKNGELSASEISRIKLQELKNKMANDRVTMRRREVAEKYKVSESYVSKLINNHPLKDTFIGNYRKNQPKNNTIRKRKKEAIQNINKDYPKLSIDAISEKWNVNKKWVIWVISPESTKKPHEAFFKTVKSKSEPKKISKKPKPKKETKKPVFLDPKDVVIKPSVPRRPVVINSKTTIYVKVDDKRTTEQIIKDYNKKYNL